MAETYTNFRWWRSGRPQEMSVADGRVVARDAKVRQQGRTVDLGGKWLLPAFVDAHCHVLPTGLDLRKLNLGPATTHGEAVELVAQRHAQQPDGWLLAVHYDQNRFPAAEHLSRDQLDKISADRPILLRHVNGHASVANSAALAVAGVDATTPDPAGGEFVRDAGGRLTGVLLEDAHERVSSAAPMPSLDEMVDAILLAGESMRNYGIVCASDMMTGRFDLRQELEAYKLASERGCPVATRLYLQWKTVFGPRAIPEQDVSDLAQDLERAGGAGSRVAGIKIFADGAIGSATAAIYGRYSGKPANGAVISRAGTSAADSTSREVSGQLIYRPDRLNEMVRIAHDAGRQVSIHAIGDYAVDLVMDAFEATGEPARHRIEHGMLLSDGQIERMAGLGCSLTFQPEFLLHFGHAYRGQLGETRAARLKRSRSVLDAGIPLSFNSDRPIVSGDPWLAIDIATTRTGYDPSERCTREEAIHAYTEAGSRVNGDADTFGTLYPGANAAFLALDNDPR